MTMRKKSPSMRLIGDLGSMQYNIKMYPSGSDGDNNLKINLKFKLEQCDLNSFM